MSRLVVTSVLLDATAGAIGSAQPPGRATIAGMVTDTTGVPIVGAEIILLGTSERVSTDERGNFRIVSVPTGAASLRVRRLGFRPESVAVTVAQVPDAATPGPTLRIRMLPAVQQLAPVVVNATRGRYSGRLADYYERLERRSSGVFIVRSDLEAGNPRSIAQVIQRQPGLEVVRRGSASTVRFRGRLCSPEIWLDGIATPLGAVDLETLPANTFHGIELYLGAATAPFRYYSESRKPCGTILLWSRDADTDPPRRAEHGIISSAELESMVTAASVFTADDVDIPVRVDPARPLAVAYPPELRAARASGVVIAEFVVDSSGSVEPGTFGVISSAEPRFTEAVRAAIEKASFIPASRQGKRVRQLVQQRVRFDVPSS
jgi:TonB family protein